MTSQLGIGIDWGLVAEDAARWASEYSYKLVMGITDTTRRLLQEKVAQFIREPGRTIGDLTADLEPYFGKMRAEMIAVTETTRAFAEGERKTVAEWQNYGARLEAVWHTNRDELVCPVCAALDGKPESEWGGMDCPAHPRCRCWITHRSIEPEIEEPLLRQQLRDVPREQKLVWIRHWLSRNASEEISTIQEAGFLAPTEMRHVTLEGLPIYFSDRSRSQLAAANTIQSLMEGRRLPRILRQELKRIVHMEGANPGDAYWNKKYGIKIVSAATGGDGVIVAWQDMGLRRGTLLHELGHLLHERSYGSVTHPAQSAFREATEYVFEMAPSYYSRVSVEEDFAESIKEYFINRTRFQRTNPRRCKAIADLLEAISGK